MKGVEMNIPALRFPGFEDEWELKKLGELLEFKNGINASKEQYGQGCKFINVLDILNNDFITHDKIIGSVDVDKETANKNIVSYGDILFQRSSETREEVGTANVYLDKEKTATFGGFVIRGRKIGEYDPIFLNKILKTDTARDEITSKSGGSTRYNVGQEILASVQLYLPTLPEQNKIASFLSAVDEKLQQLKQEKAHLVQYKKGVMQQIFNQEIRFKDDDGSEYPYWEEKMGNEIFETITDKNHQSDLPILAITQEFGAIPRDMIDYNVIASEKSIDSYKVVQMGDFIISLRSFEGGIEYSTYKGICSPAYIILRPFIPINDLFFKCYLKTPNYIKKLNRNIEGIRDGKMISYKYFSEIELPYPSLPEQIKIANFLSSIDEKITNITNQITLTEQWKKGLLQGMFV
jgi:type I restriction enzyme S subunit